MANNSYKQMRLARFYDFVISRSGLNNLELDFWKKCAEVYGDPICEMGCDTGRILIPLALEGNSVYGTDCSEHFFLNLKRR